MKRKAKPKPSAASQDFGRLKKGASSHGYTGARAKRYRYGHFTNVRKGKFNKGRATKG